MPERAQVNSIEALEAFRASLIVYLEKAGGALDEVSDEVLRTRMRLQDDRLPFWEKQVRHCARVLEEKQQELFGAQLSGLRETTQAEREAANKAKLALHRAEAKLHAVKQWKRQYDSRVQPLMKEVDKLRDVLTGHMGKAVVFLTQATRLLAEYADRTPEAGPRNVTGPNQSATPAASSGSTPENTNS